MARPRDEVVQRAVSAEETYRFIYRADPDPDLALAIARSDLPPTEFGDFLTRSASLFRQTGDGVMRDPSKELQPVPTPSPQPPKPPTTPPPLPGVRPTPAGPPSTPYPTPTPQPSIGPGGEQPTRLPNFRDLEVRYDVRTLNDVRMLLIDQGFLAESQILRKSGADGQGPDVWDERWDQATVKAFLRYTDRNYRRLEEQQDRAVHAGYGYDPVTGKELKVDGILSPEWVRAFGEMARDEINDQLAIQELPWWLAPIRRALPNNRTMRQLWFEISGRKGHGDIDLLTPVTRTLHTLGTSVVMAGQMFPPYIAIEYIKQFKALDEDPEYKEAMQRAYDALDLGDREALRNSNKIEVGPETYIGGPSTVNPLSELLLPILERDRMNPAAQKALQDAEKVRERVMKEMPDTTYLEMFGVVDKKALQENPNLQTVAIAADILFDFLVIGKVGAKQWALPRGDPQHVLQDKGAQRLAAALVSDITKGHYAAAAIKLGETRDAYRLIGALRRGEEKAARAGGHITEAYALRSLAKSYALGNFNVETGLSRSAQIRSWMVQHPDLAIARMMSIRPRSGKVPSLANDPNIYRETIRYAREVYRNPDLIDGVAERLSRAKNPAMVGKVIDSINEDLSRYYRTAAGEAGMGVGYLGHAEVGNRVATRTRTVAGMVIDEPTPLLPTEQRTRVGFVGLRHLVRKSPGEGAIPAPTGFLDRAEMVADSVYTHFIRDISEGLNKPATFMRYSMTVLSPILATRKYVTALIRRVLDVGWKDDVAMRAFMTEVNASKKFKQRMRMVEDELDHVPIAYEVGGDDLYRPFGGRWRAQEQPGVARDFFRRLYDDDLVGAWLRGATGAGTPKMSNRWNWKKAEAEAVKWLSTNRGLRLTEQFGIVDAAGNPDTLKHAQMVSEFLRSYAKTAPNTMYMLVNRSGDRAKDLKGIFKVLETSNENPWVSGLMPATGFGDRMSRVGRDFVTATWQGRLATDKIPVIGNWLATHGVESIPYGFALPMAAERRTHFRMIAAKTYKRILEENPTGDKRHALEAAIEFALERTHRVQLDLSRMWNIEASMRWAAFFATKKRLWYTMLADYSWKNPGVAGALSKSARELEEINVDQPEYLRYSLPWKLESDGPWGPAGTVVRIPLDRMLWLSELPLWSSLITIPFLFTSDRAKAAEEASKGRLSFTRFDSAIYTLAKLKEFNDDPTKFREEMGEKEYQQLLKDERTDPQTLRMFLFNHPELSRHYWRINHEMLLAEMRGQPISRAQAERQTMGKWAWEQGIPLIRPVTFNLQSPEHQAFLRDQATYESITDEKERQKFFQSSKYLQEWRYLYEDPDRRQQLVDGWGEYYALRSQMDAWAEEFYGAEGDISRVSDAVLNRHEAFKMEQWFQGQVDDIAKRYPEWSRVFLDDDRTDRVKAQRSEAYENLAAVFPNLRVRKEDLVPNEEQEQGLSVLDNLAKAEQLFEGTEAEQDFRILLADARRLSPDLAQFRSPPRNANERIVKRYIEEVYYPALDRLGYYFDLIDALRQRKVPTHSIEYTKVYSAIRETRDALAGPFTIDGVTFPGIEEVQWGSWDDTQRYDHLVSWATLPRSRRTKFQDRMVEMNDRNELFRESIRRRLTGRALLEEAGLLEAR